MDNENPNKLEWIPTKLECFTPTMPPFVPYYAVCPCVQDEIDYICRLSPIDRFFYGNKRIKKVWQEYNKQYNECCILNKEARKNNE